MAYQFDYEKGLQEIQRTGKDLIETADVIVTTSIETESPAVLQAYPWEELRKYLAYCFQQLGAELKKSIVEQCTQYEQGAGGFAAFAKNTDNCDEAVAYTAQMAAAVNDLMNECLKDYETCVTGALNQLTVTDSKFDENVKQTLEQMHQKAVTELEGKREAARKKVKELADENLIITPLLGAVEILFGTCIAWYQALKTSVSGFMEYAEQLIENGRQKAEAAVAAAAQSAARALPAVRFSVESE